MDTIDTVEWLLEGDPAVVWQVERDLLSRRESRWKASRKRVALEGWGRRLLDERASDGTWGGGLYNPKWTSTFYTLRLLTQLGLSPRHPKGVASCRLLLERGVSESGGARFWSSSSTDTCVTGMLLSMAAHFGLAATSEARRMVSHLLGEQMDDGGWNCRLRRGARHGSFHTTLSTLEGLVSYRAYRAAPRKRRSVEVDRAIAGGIEFFLVHQLYRSCRTGRVVKPAFAKLSFPPRWYFDLLRGLELFCALDAPRDERLSDAVAVLERKRRPDGRWPIEGLHAGKTFFPLERAGQPSRVNTLRALRVLKWWRSSDLRSLLSD